MRRSHWQAQPAPLCQFNYLFPALKRLFEHIWSVRLNLSSGIDGERPLSACPVIASAGFPNAIRCYFIQRGLISRYLDRLGTSLGGDLTDMRMINHYQVVLAQAPRSTRIQILEGWVGPTDRYTGERVPSISGRDHRAVAARMIPR